MELLSLWEAASVAGAALRSVISLVQRLQVDLDGELTKLRLVERQIKLLGDLENTLDAESESEVMNCLSHLNMEVGKIRKWVEKGEFLARFNRDKINKHLNECTELLRHCQYCFQFQKPPLYVSRQPSDSQPLLRALLAARNESCLTMAQLKARGILVEDCSAFKERRFVSVRTKLYVVDKLPKGYDDMEIERRKRRLASLIAMLQNIEMSRIAKIAKFGWDDHLFYVLSETETTNTLEDMIGQIADKKAVLLKIALAICKMHEIFLVHEGICASNVLLSDNGEIKLTGFVRARSMLEPSLSVDPPDDLQKYNLYQAPERVGDVVGSYSLPCDVYSFGVLMLEVLLNRSFLAYPSIKGHDDIIRIADGNVNASQVGPVVRDCLLKSAPLRPTIDMVYYRLKGASFEASEPVPSAMDEDLPCDEYAQFKQPGRTIKRLSLYLDPVLDDARLQP